MEKPKNREGALVFLLRSELDMSQRVVRLLAIEAECALLKVEILEGRR